jgi:hypothetical protein
MARRRSVLGDLCLQLTLQAAFAVGAIHAAQAADATFTKHALINAPANDAFVFTGSSVAPEPTFEDLMLDLYTPSLEVRADDDYGQLPDIDAALLGGPEPSYDWHSADDFILFN